MNTAFTNQTKESELNPVKCNPNRHIALLPDLLIGQIAAGEVVDRPASVVKELLENALDAQAKNITVRLDGGGVGRIVVQDDGVGIANDQLPLAVTRHATSKIQNLDDLEHVATLGFRGEALASIASVSQFTLSSQPKGQGDAYAIHNHDGPWQTTLCNQGLGSMVDVQSLYFSTPARRKFLKSEQTEFFHALDVVKRIALAYPQVAFVVYRDGKVHTRLPATNWSTRLFAVLETMANGASKPIEVSAGALHLHGAIGLPSAARGRADTQFFYVNGRFVKDKLINHALRSAYEDVLHGDKFPSFVLFLQLPPNQVDVNVHPAKTEVRFRDARAVHQWLRQCVQQSLAHSQSALHASKSSSLPSWRVQTNANTYTLAEPNAAYDMHRPQQLPLPQLQAMFQPDFQVQTKAQTQIQIEHELHPQFDQTASNHLGQAVALIHGIYIVAQRNDGMVVVDMHAAHERILYEQFKATFDAQQTMASQSLLVPLLVAIDPRMAQELEQGQELWQRFGFELSLLSPQQVAVRAVPLALANVDVASLLQTWFADVQAHGVAHVLEQKRNEWLAGLACRAAVHANCNLSVPEMNALLRAMETTSRADQCNHGRPTWRLFSWAQMDAWFLRGQ